jgi:hypothetical protein
LAERGHHGVGAVQRDADARQRLDRWLAEIDRRLRAAGIGEGSAALLVGPLVYRAVFQAARVDDALVDRLVSVVLMPPDLPPS